ncbi:MAG: hypothetical protein K5987_01995 [Lachnospiraceae bacterium]|nr:hypothetical protein [Lachnospiraceae bacterium]
MKNKTLNILYIVIFISMLLALFVCMTFSHSDMSVEKREAAALPKAVSEDGTLNLSYFDELDDYMSDNFAFRQELATADALMKAKVFKTSGNEKAVVGKNDWLYFTGSMNDYLGREILNKRQINAAAKVLKIMQTDSENKGRKFIFVCAPNKNSLYPENMPSRYLKSEDAGNYELLKAAMEEEGVNTVDLHEAFKADKRVMYYKWDSHWDNEGAAFAVDKILAALDKEHYDYESEPYTIEESHRGDIMNLIYPSLDAMDEEVVYEKQHEYKYLNPVESVEDILIFTQAEGKEGSVLMFRDSFGNATLPYIADEYGRGIFSKGVPYNFSYAASGKSDTVIVEIVERNIPWLIEYVPYMEAPETEINAEIIKAEDAETSLNTEDKGADNVYYGTLDKFYTDDNAEVIMKVTLPDGEEKFYEAFPSSYTEVSSPDEAQYSYGIYINKNLTPAGSRLEVIAVKDGVYYSVAELDL